MGNRGGGEVCIYIYHVVGRFMGGRGELAMRDTVMGMADELGVIANCCLQQ